MRNNYAGVCYYCGIEVKPQQGHFERYKGGWRTIHASCVFQQRKDKEYTTPIDPNSVVWKINTTSHQKISTNIGTFERKRHPDWPDHWMPWEICWEDKVD